MRLPFLPTAFVAAAVAVMIGLGLWQLERARWKQGLLDELAAAPSRPEVNLDEGDAPAGKALAFRRARLTCLAEGKPEVRAGRNRQGTTGYRYLVPCRPATAAAALTIDAGWSQRPDAVARVSETRTFAGVLSGESEAGEPLVLTIDPPVPPLEASAPPSVDDIPNNHLFYAAQWFFFAAAAVVIYLLALRRRARG